MVPSLKTAEQFKKSSLVWGYVVSILAVAPTLVWILLDTSAWGGDQSQYGRAALELFHALRHSPTEWLTQMLDVFPSKPNGLIWLGQFFVPLRHLVGSIDAALLFSITLMQAVTLILIYGSIWELSNRTSLAIPAIGCLAVASAPLFISFGAYYLVESMQTLSVAWFVLIMSLAPRWNRTLILGQLSAAAAFALLTKEIQPLFCLWPGLVSLRYVFRTRQIQPSEGALRSTTILTFVLGIPLVVATLAWYYRNLEPVAHHLYAGSYGPGVRIFWGKEDTYLNTLAYWLSTTKSVFFLPGIWELGLLLVASGVIYHFARSHGPMKHFTVCAAAATLQIITVLLVFSLSPTRQPRYLLPVLPYLAVLLSWSVGQIKHWMIAGLTIAVFAVQLALLQGQALNVVSSLSPWLRPFDRDAKNGRVIKSIVARTCNKTDSKPYLNILAIDPALQGDWLAPEPANYVAAKNSLLQNHRPPCYYGYLGVDFFGSTVADAWNSMLSNQARYFITVDPKIYPVPALVFNKTLNEDNFPVMLEKVQTSGLFEAEPPLREDPGILIFRR